MAIQVNMVMISVKGTQTLNIISNVITKEQNQKYNTTRKRNNIYDQSIILQLTSSKIPSYKIINDFTTVLSTDLACSLQFLLHIYPVSFLLDAYPCIPEIYVILFVSTMKQYLPINPINSNTLWNRIYFLNLMNFSKVTPLVLVLLCVFSTKCLGFNLQGRILQNQNFTRTALETVYVYESGFEYFFYNVFNENDDIQIQIIDKNLETHNLTLATDNTSLVFRDANNRYIVIEEQDQTGKLMSYWVIIVNRNKFDYLLDGFPISSEVDNQNFPLEGKYMLSKIIQLDKFDQQLYVTLEPSDTENVTNPDFNVYAIDVAGRSGTLVNVNWFPIQTNQTQNVLGGNSRVFVFSNDQIWIQGPTTRQPGAQGSVITFDKFNANELTSFQIYPNGSKVYDLLGPYFQYVSLSEDELNMTTFVFSGYTNETIQGEGSLSSSQPIKFFSDEQTFFLAIGDSSTYLTYLKQETQTGLFTLFNGNLTQSSDQNFYEALTVGQRDDKIFVLTNETLFVVSPMDNFSVDNQTLDQPVGLEANLEQELLKNMFQYQEGR